MKVSKKLLIYPIIILLILLYYIIRYFDKIEEFTTDVYVNNNKLNGKYGITCLQCSTPCTSDEFAKSECGPTSNNDCRAYGLWSELKGEKGGFGNYKRTNAWCESVDGKMTYIFFDWRLITARQGIGYSSIEFRMSNGRVYEVKKGAEFTSKNSDDFENAWCRSNKHSNYDRATRDPVTGEAISVDPCNEGGWKDVYQWNVKYRMVYA